MERAITWYSRAANASDPVWSPQAHLRLGAIYQGEHGERYQHLQKAQEHYRACAEQGVAECSRELERLAQFPALAIIAAQAGSPSEGHRIATGITERGAITPPGPVVAASPSAGTSAEVLSQQAIALYARHEPSVYKITVYEQLAGDLKPLSLGSAIAIDSFRAITNYHLVAAGGIPVSINSEGEFIRESDVLIWRVARTDPRRDLALLELVDPHQELNFTNTMKPYDSVQVGERVFAIGAPAGFDKTLTEGIVSALRRERGVRLIQTTAPVTYGSSGGALFDAQGRLIGITTKGVQAGGHFNFAIAADEVQAFLAE
ncbi:trypsin-like peptidase domain-containing protein [Zobellella sp. CGMCC 1.18722]|uniref:Trypsin-like peptidase domain-containing protein n=1 Tax=Zobellella iuensis TaxID=2803811 RepID=A0ABS1QVP5_9GAMM|nr:trypsin-like peptidase domain-containing protein [Zobellella iuensis]